MEEIALWATLVSNCGAVLGFENGLVRRIDKMTMAVGGCP